MPFLEGSNFVFCMIRIEFLSLYTVESLKRVYQKTHHQLDPALKWHWQEMYGWKHILTGIQCHVHLCIDKRKTWHQMFWKDRKSLYVEYTWDPTQSKTFSCALSRTRYRNLGCLVRELLGACWQCAWEPCLQRCSCSTRLKKPSNFWTCFGDTKVARKHHHALNVCSPLICLVLTLFAASTINLMASNIGHQFNRTTWN